MTLRFSTVLVVFFGLACSIGQAQDLSLVPCKAASDMDSDDLILAARLAKQLGRDRAPIEVGGWPKLRIHVLPDYSPGSPDGPPEWVVSLYVPDDGDAILELAIPQGSIRGANSAWKPVPDREKPTWVFQALEDEQEVPVRFQVKKIERLLAERLVSAVNRQIVGARHGTGPLFEMRVHLTTYQFSAWEFGHGDRCAQMEAHAEEFEQSPLGKLALALREYAESKKHEPKTKKISKRLDALETQ